jgi:hypothetical protein
LRYAAAVGLIVILVLTLAPLASALVVAWSEARRELRSLIFN